MQDHDQNNIVNLPSQQPTSTTEDIYSTWDIHPGGLSSEIMDCGGLIGQMSKYINEQAMSHAPEFAFWASIGAIGHLAGNKVFTSTGLKPGMAIIVLAESGSGKGNPQFFLENLMLRLGIVKTLITNIGTGQGLEDAFDITSNKMLLVLDEVGHLFADMANESISQNSAEKVLKQLLSPGINHYTGRMLSRRGKDAKKPVSISQPHMTLLGFSTTDQFTDNINKAMIHGGLLGRLLVPVIQPGKIKPNAPKRKSIPSELILGFAPWIESFTREDPVVPFSPDAFEQWNLIRTSCHSFGQNETDLLKKTQFHRAAEKVAQLALVKSISNHGLGVKEITREDVVWGESVTVTCMNRLFELADGSMFITKRKIDNRRVTEAIRTSAGDDGWSTRTKVMRKVNNHLSGDELSTILSELVDAELIERANGAAAANGRFPTLYKVNDWVD